MSACDAVTIDSSNWAERNVESFYLFGVLANTVGLFLSSFIPLLKSCGMTEGEVCYLQAWFILIVAGLQYPAGYFADFAGRRLSMLVGASFWVLGLWVYARATSIPAFVLGETILGAGSAFVSGADKALLRASLDRLGRGAEYDLVLGRMMALGQTAFTLALVAGSALAAMSDRAPFHAALLGHIVLLGLVLGRLREVRTPGAPGLDLRKETPIKVLYWCLWKNRRVAWLAMMRSLLLSFTLAGFWFSVPLLIECGVPKELHGLWLGAFSVVVAGASLFARRTSILAGRGIFVLLTVLLVLGFAAPLGSGLPWVALGLTLQKIVVGCGFIVFSKRLMDESPPELRSSVASAAEACLNATQFAVLMGAGWLIDRLGSAAAAYGVCSVVIAALGCVLLCCSPFRGSRGSEAG